MHDDPYDDLPPSKSQLKREAHSLQALGEALVKLNKSSLAKIPLPEELFDAITTAQRMPQRGALKRQLQLIGKLMRQTDADPIREAYDKIINPYKMDVAHHHKLETWRTRLLQEGDKALGDLLDNYPSADRQHIRQLVRRAHKEKESNKSPKSARELFQYLRDLLQPETDPHTPD